MADLRHGPPCSHSGWLLKEGNNGMLWKRFMRINGTALTNSFSEGSQPTWQVSTIDCPVLRGERPLEFVITIRKRKLRMFAQTLEEFEEWERAFQKSMGAKFENCYEVGEVIGEGGFAEVRLVRDTTSKEIFAVKKIRKGKFEVRETQFINNEVSIMKTIAHENIVDTRDIFECPKYLHIVMECMHGGELYDIISSHGSLSEKRASEIFSEIVKGVAYLHEAGIVHCDIKPENILCKNKDWPLRVKLCDFGLSNFYDKSSDATLLDGHGTPGYMAPEVIKREPYGPPVDMWSCGVVLYVMLSGTMPFFGRNIFEIQRKTVRGQLAFPEIYWKNVSDDAKSLIRGLLQMVPHKRLTAKATLLHKWLSRSKTLSEADLGNDLSGMSSKGDVRQKLKKVFGTIVTMNILKDQIAASDRRRS